MAAPTVHVENDDSSDSEVVPDEFSDGSDASEELVTEENNEENNGSDSEEEKNVSTTGLGNVISKILQKNIAAKCSVLSKGLTDRQIHKKRKLKQADEASLEKKSKDGDSSDESDASDDVDDSDDDSDADEKSGLKNDPLRVQPDPLQRKHEKLLQKIATKGVVHLFNAVQKQQKTIDEKLKIAGGSEIKKGRAMKTVTKGRFMDMLKQNEKNTKSDSLITDNEPSWKILRDDFMMSAKMKDWDKESDDGGGSDG